MIEDDLEPWLAVWRLPGIGPAMFAEILKAYEDPGHYLGASESDRKQRGLEGDGVTAPRELEAVQAGIEADRRWMESEDNRHIIHLRDPRYPSLLKELNDAPPLLFVRGSLDALAEPQLAIVGARSASKNGIHAAEEFAAHLAASGLTITSGLALGIDAAAHEGALAAKGSTIAVMATGPDRLYPRENRHIADAIIEQGALVTEMPTGTPVVKGFFPRRNRIISGLSLGVLVVEAGRKSGALGTAYCAIEQGREVMAIPGSIHNPVARGCHQLIRKGARLVETVDDVIEEIKGLRGRFTLTAPPPDDDGDNDRHHETLDVEYQALLTAMGHDPIAFDQLAARLSLTPDILSSLLLSLELRGYVAPCNGGRYMRTSNQAGG